jgi:hypothetical protein
VNGVRVNRSSSIVMAAHPSAAPRSSATSRTIRYLRGFNDKAQTFW